MVHFSIGKTKFNMIYVSAVLALLKIAEVLDISWIIVLAPIWGTVIFVSVVWGIGILAGGKITITKDKK